MGRLLEKPVAANRLRSPGNLATPSALPPGFGSYRPGFGPGIVDAGSRNRSGGRWEIHMLTSLRPSGPRECGPAILCVIALGLCSPDRAGAATLDAPPRTLAVEARDLASDAPVKGILFKLIVSGGIRVRGERATRMGSHASNTRFPRRPARAHTFSITARREGLVPLVARWIEETLPSEPPDRLLFQTEAGTDPQRSRSRPGRSAIAGAVVVASVSKKVIPGPSSGSTSMASPSRPTRKAAGPWAACRNGRIRSTLRPTTISTSPNSELPSGAIQAAIRTPGPLGDPAARARDAHRGDRALARRPARGRR